MKMAMTALAVVFLAGAAPALAQPAGIGRREGVDRPWRGEGQGRPQADGGQRGGGEDRGGENRGERWGGGGPRSRDTTTVPDAPRAPEAPRAAEPRPQGQAMPAGGRDRVAPDQRRTARTDDGARGGDRRQPDRREWDRSSQPRADAPRTDGGRADGDRRGGARGDWRGRADGDRRGGDRGDWRAHGDGDRRGGDRGDWRGRDGDRGGRYDHQGGDNRGGDHRRWDRGHYPSVYFSSHRYRQSWRPPYGYYVHAWNFGEFLPRSWYGEEYFIADPWTFDLPLAPPGYDWVRVGDDALLIDSFNGRVVQVVRDVFW